MEIDYKSNSLKKKCNESARANREWGPDLAKKVRLRLSQLKLAENLLEFSELPATGFHQLRHNRKDHFAVKLTGNYRLIFRPLENPIPRLPDGGIDLEKIAGTLIVEVVDYHGD